MGAYPVSNKKNWTVKSKKNMYHYLDIPMQFRDNGDDLYTALYTKVSGLALWNLEEQIIIAACININRGSGWS